MDILGLEVWSAVARLARAVRPPYTTCYNRFVRWRRAGVWDCILAAISHREDAAVQMIDSSIVRAISMRLAFRTVSKNILGRSR